MEAMSFSLIQASSFCSASILFTKVSRSPSLAFATPCRSRQLEAPIRVCSAVRTSEYSQTGATTSSSGSLELVSTKDVAETEVADRQRLFNRIAPMYDSLNDWLSLGQHRVWKRMAVSWSGAKLGDSVLDICCGSGDVAFLLAEKVGPQGKVTGLDFAREQLDIATQRQLESVTASSIDMQWVQGDALNLPFRDCSFDAITMGYGLRNVASIPLALREIHRVLKPGSKASILDFNHSQQQLTQGLQDWMLDNVVVPIATQFGLQEEYAYLKTSIAQFPTGTQQERLALNEGFPNTVHYEIAGGFMGVLVITR
ncbi:hypothetical protein CY35_04G148200 [Sphagnum magellanicum]|nr:hypothetical protein CY35_04G148200 [Sphagnum magellanicum]